MPRLKITRLLAGLLMVFGLTIPGAGSIAVSAELPRDDPGLFSYLFTEKSIPANWIAGPASEELTPAMLTEIAEKLSREGGQYKDAKKTARGWLLEFQNGSVRSRIVRANDRKIVGVFFSGLE